MTDRSATAGMAALRRAPAASRPGVGTRNVEHDLEFEQ
jgi:hypothetical protein